MTVCVVVSNVMPVRNRAREREEEEEEEKGQEQDNNMYEMKK